MKTILPILAITLSLNAAALAQEAVRGQDTPGHESSGQAAGPGMPVQMPDVIGSQPDSQSYPARFSERNDALDKLPIMGHPVPLTDEQKRQIVDAVKHDGTPPETIATRPAQILPWRVDVQPLPDGIAGTIPILGHLGYVRTPDRILLVMPANKIVTGVVATQ